MARTLTVAAVALGILTCSACHTMRFEVSDEIHRKTVTERKSYFLFGLAPTVEVDVSTKCENGLIAVEEETTFGDGFFSLITLDIWSPRTTTYYCR